MEGMWKCEDANLPLGVADRGCVCGLGDENIRAHAVDPCSSKMAVRSHVVVTRVHNTLGANSNMEQGSPKHVPRIVCGDANVIPNSNCLTVSIERVLWEPVVDSLQ